MDTPQRQHRLLVGIGLVVIGLLGGVLFTLIYSGDDRRPRTEFTVVERVDLGAAAPQAHPSALSLNKMFREVAVNVTKSVVSVQVEGGWRERFHGFGQSDDEAYRDMPRESVGSGVIVSAQGHIVTNSHVVDRARGVRVTLADKREYDAELLGSDRSTDLAVLKIDIDDGDEITPIPIGDSDDLYVGDWVLAIGNPFRLNSTITAGIVSALGRQVSIIDDDFLIEDFIQTDAAINPGNSGGALVNLRGELVGINTAIATESGWNEGYGFAIPVSLVERVTMDLIHYGEMQRGYLGVTIESVDASHARMLGLDRIGGVYLDRVEEGSAADRGGLREGDVLLAVGGRDVNATNELQSTIARHRPGDELSVDFWREGQQRSALVRLLGRDDPAVDGWLASLRAGAGNFGEVFHLEGWGLVLRELTDRDRRRFDVEDGVVVSYVVAGSSGAAADIPRNAVVEEVDGEAVDSVEDVVRLFVQAADDGAAVAISMRLQDGSAARFEVDAPGLSQERP